jgi:endonuclease/exonuclease/phosphatase family metal-dependent hydrolase
MRLRVLTWNLMHGRARPSAGRDLRPEFTAALAGWEWDVALLQEVPPWWPEPLAADLHAEYRLVLTSRNGLLTLRRAIATRWPDLVRSNGGGCNAILARQDRIIAHHTRLLRRYPERRWLHAARLACGIWVGNLHASADPMRAARDGELATLTARAWAGREPLVLGGDFNQREFELAGLTRVGERDVDHVFVGPGVRMVREFEVLDRGTLSDHPPLVATVERPD